MKKEKTGIVYDGQHLVVVNFAQEDYISLWDGTRDDYLDFVLARAERLMHREKKGLFESLNCTEVPFDLSDYSAWLSCDPRRAEYSDPIGQWAVEVAGDPLKLSCLCVKHQNSLWDLLPPPDEQLQVEVLAWTAAVLAENPKQLAELLEPLPHNF